MKNKEKKTVGIIGFGRFGILTATVLSDFFEIKVFHYRKKKDNEVIAKKIGVKLVDLDEVVNCDYLILATPISKTEEMIKKVSKLLKPKTVVMDVCSVKTLPCKWLKKNIKDNSILGTHPMFGPVTTKFDLNKKHFNLKDKQIILCPIKISDKKVLEIRKFLEKLDLKVIVTTSKDHDKQNAKTLSLVHFLGRSLTQTGVKEQKIFTPGYTDLLSILPHTNHDDWQLFYDMNNYNPYSEKVRKDFLKACDFVENKIIKAESGDAFDFNRNMINKIDQKIFSLLEERIGIAREIGKIKKEIGKPIVDLKREREIIGKRKGEVKLDEKFIEKIYKVIFKESRNQQK